MAEQTVVEKAKQMGWAPQAEFRGDPTKWIDADEYVRRGEQLMPILRANNERLMEEVGKLRSENAQTQQLLKASGEAIEELKKFNTKTTKKALADQKETLVEGIKAARREGDVDSELVLQDQLTEVSTALRQADTTPKVSDTAAGPAGGAPPPVMDSPGWKAFVAENPWFGKDKRRTALAVAIGEELRGDPANSGLTGKPFFDKVADEVEKQFNPGASQRRQPSKVEGGGGGGGDGGGSSAGRSFADLPAEAQAACKRQSSRLVGPGRAYKDLSAWQTAYATKYFEAE